jgi:hypothetical protein
LSSAPKEVSCTGGGLDSDINAAVVAAAVRSGGVRVYLGRVFARGWGRGKVCETLYESC